MMHNAVVEASIILGSRQSLGACTLKVSILNRFFAKVIITVDIDCEADAPQSLKLGLAVKVALSLKADLTSANLTSANLTSADLTSANLRYADLRYANLTSANLTSANLTSANLTYANLTSANLTSANLTYANLTSANLTSADLTYANLTSADLTYADLRYANLTSPTMVLLANWTGDLTVELTADLMEYDASCHPDRTKFDDWAAGGSCPYDGVKIQRAANFKEVKSLWGQGKLCGAYSLMMRLFTEQEIKR